MTEQPDLSIRGEWFSNQGEWFYRAEARNKDGRTIMVLTDPIAESAWQMAWGEEFSRERLEQAVKSELKRRVLKEQERRYAGFPEQV